MKRLILTLASLLACGASAEACGHAYSFRSFYAAPQVTFYYAPAPAPTYYAPPPMAYAPAPCPCPPQQTYQAPAPTYAAPAPVYAPPVCDYGAAPAFAPAYATGYAFAPSYGVGYGTTFYRQRTFYDVGFFHRVHSHALFLHHSGGLRVAAPGVRVRVGR